MEKKKMVSEHHLGREVAIPTICFALSGQENCDSFEYNVLHEAGKYILELEEKIECLETMKDVKCKACKAQLKQAREIERNMLKEMELREGRVKCQS